MNILVSACLLGVSCKYSGGDNRCEALLKLLDNPAFTLIPVCPEIYGGLSTPRVCAERVGDLVLTSDGCDVTAQYCRGAGIALDIARIYHCTAAILKENSPSCGFGSIYDGTFSHRKIPGSGVAAQLLSDNGIRIYNENNFSDLTD